MWLKHDSLLWPQWKEAGGKVSIITVLGNWGFFFLFWLHLFKTSVAVWPHRNAQIQLIFLFFQLIRAEQNLMPPTPGPDQVCDHQHWCSSHPPVQRGLASYLEYKKIYLFTVNEWEVHCVWRCFQLFLRWLLPGRRVWVYPIPTKLALFTLAWEKKAWNH